MKAIKALLVFAILAFGTQSFAKVNFIEALAEKYPNILDDETGKLLDCFSCHTTDKWQRNDFGLELQAEVRAEYLARYGTRPTTQTVYERDFIREMLTKIEDRDSDGDGYSNKVEIEALTFPGDMYDFPAAQ